jgi:CRISPR-associated endonuclease Cas2
MYKFGPIQKKILITLLGGVALGMSNSPRQYYRTLRTIRRDWKNVNQHSFNRSVGSLAREKFVLEKRLPDGSFELTLTKEGEKEAKRLSLLGSSIKFKKPKRWDKRWRLVIFDIPEKDREFRDILRGHLQELGFKKLQHSVFVSPYPFEKAISELTGLYSAGKYVRVITAINIDNEKSLKNHFFK